MAEWPDNCVFRTAQIEIFPPSIIVIMKLRFVVKGKNNLTPNRTLKIKAHMSYSLWVFALPFWGPQGLCRYRKTTPRVDKREILGSEMLSLQPLSLFDLLRYQENQKSQTDAEWAESQDNSQLSTNIGLSAWNHVNGLRKVVYEAKNQTYVMVTRMENPVT